MNNVIIPVEQLDHAGTQPLPDYATSGSAGMDLIAAIDEDIVLEPGARTLVPTGLKMAIPDGFEAQIRPRSGLAFKHGITCLNTPGTIDSDYRGEVKVILANLGNEPVTIERDMRVAQMVIARVWQAAWQVQLVSEDTNRGSGGFGSTGTNA